MGFSVNAAGGMPDWCMFIVMFFCPSAWSVFGEKSCGSKTTWVQWFRRTRSLEHKTHSKSRTLMNVNILLFAAAAVKSSGIG